MIFEEVHKAMKYIMGVGVYDDLRSHYQTGTATSWKGQRYCGDVEK